MIENFHIKIQKFKMVQIKWQGLGSIADNH